MWLKVICDLSFDLTVPTPFILMLRPQTLDGQTIISNEYVLSPKIPMSEFVDQFGNLCQRLEAPAGIFSIRTASIVDVPETIEQSPGAPYVDVQKLPDFILRYLLPSRYCESDRFGDLASIITMNVNPGYDQVAAIVEWMRTTIQYTPGNSEIPYSAIEVNYRQSGVCRDFAHLGIALCRSLTIPARIVVGFLHELKPMDMHAWFEAYVGGKWYTFDAIHKSPKAGYVVVGYGRDVADVALYNQFGPSVFPFKQDAHVERLNHL